MNQQPIPKLILLKTESGRYDLVIEIRYNEYPVTVTLAVEQEEETARSVAYDTQDFLSVIWSEK